MRILLPTMRDPGQIGGTSTHIDMLSRGLEELGHEARVLYSGGDDAGAAAQGRAIWPAGALNRVRRGWGMMYAAEAPGPAAGLGDGGASSPGPTTGRCPLGGAERPGGLLGAPLCGRWPTARLPLVLTLHGYPLYESVSEGYSAASQYGRITISCGRRCGRCAWPTPWSPSTPASTGTRCGWCPSGPTPSTRS